MNCCICEGSAASRHLVAGAHELVKCRTCGLIYVSNFAGVSYDGEEYFTREKDYVRRWNEFVSIFEPLLDKVREYKKGGVLLDVGAGVGILVDLASKMGFEAKGVEISGWASAYARNERGLDVVTGILENSGFQPACFDVVVVNHVIEHVPSPRAMLAEIRRILKDDGLLVIGAPNVDSLMAMLRRDKWVALLPGEHIWHFAPDTLSRLAEISGFRVLRVEARDNPSVSGWSLKDILRRAINAVAVATGRSESMLLFASKCDGGSR